MLLNTLFWDLFVGVYMQQKTADPHQQPTRFVLDNTLVKTRLIIIAATTLLVTVCVFFASDQVALFLHQRQQQPDTENLARELHTYIIQYYAESVRRLASRQEIGDICIGTTAIDNPTLLRVLNTSQNVLNVSLVYVMNREGTVVGCSTAPDEMSLTGNNYRFRPYFYQAIAGTPYIFPAVGITTNAKGIYFSAPVYESERSEPIGVVVIKTKSHALDSIFASLHKKGLEALLCSSDGVIFASTRNQWNFRTAKPIAPNRLQEIRASKQFSHFELSSLPFSLENSIVHYDGLRATVVVQPLQIVGWHIVTLAPVPFPWFVVLLISCIVLSLGMLTAVIMYNAHREEQLAGQIIAGQEVSNRANAAYKTSVLELETIFSTSLVGIVLVRNGLIVNANKRMCEMFGYDQDEMINSDVRRLFSGRRTFRRFVRRHLHLLMDSNIEQVEYDLKKKNGALIPCTLSGKAIARSNLAQGTVWVVEDVSRWKAAEQELKHAREAAEAASLAKGQFLANMSHEIRTPMNGIIGLTNILLRYDIPDGQREYLVLIRRSAIRLMTIINDILDFSKLEAGRFELDQRPFSLRGLLREVVQPMEPTARRKKVQLKLTVDPAVPDILHGDQTKVMQVLTNLIDNSLKFTDKGSVNVEVRLEKQDQSFSQTVLFKVADTGIGIVPAYHPKVFESFFQANASHNRKVGGTGLGLSISKGLVVLMGGHIWFDSEPGKGTNFYFTLPLTLHAENGPESGDSSENGQREKEMALQACGKRILVAEDEYINTILISTLLKQAGYHITAVRSGGEAVAAWRGGSFDCILMDIQMPEMDGYEAVARIREVEGADEHIPIIAMTAYAMSGDRQKCLAAGMDDYIAKPIDGTMVLHLLRRYLPVDKKQPTVAANSEPS